MNEEEAASVLGPALSEALARKGYAALTPIQLAVLDPATEGRDLRLTSQTGSGKTVAIGFLLRQLAQAGRVPRPRALVITPTRELAKQVRDELGWLYASLGTRIASVTGGSSYILEQRSLHAEPAIVVGTPGRLLDHLERGSFDTSDIGAIVLDEADRMLDLGFREDLEKIFKKVPGEHRTHLVSATFPRDVERLADRVQDDPMHVEGTRLGDANVDIEHMLHLVAMHERFSALVNVLLAGDEPRSIVFARTRAEVGELSDQLSRAGFRVASLSGEMEQRERTRALNAFREGAVSVLVATDVAARGLDVAAVDRVIHFTAPTEADAYTHRSGRTGRAGRRGTSHVLVAPREFLRVRRVLDDASVTYRVEPVPTKADVDRLRLERFVEELTSESDVVVDERTTELAQRLMAGADIEGVLARLLARSDFAKQPAPRDVSRVDPQRRDGPPDRYRDDRDSGRSGPSNRRDDDTAWSPFRVTWGATHGADPRRLLAMVCRRGGVESRSVGAIRIGPTWSTVNVAAPVADAFATAAARPDPRDPRVTIAPDRGPPAGRSDGPPRGDRGRPDSRVDVRPHRGSGPSREGAPRSEPREEPKRPAPASRRDVSEVREEAKRPAPPSRRDVSEAREEPKRPAPASRRDVTDPKSAPREDAKRPARGGPAPQRYEARVDRSPSPRRYEGGAKPAPREERGGYVSRGPKRFGPSSGSSNPGTGGGAGAGGSGGGRGGGAGSGGSSNHGGGSTRTTGGPGPGHRGGSSGGSNSGGGKPPKRNKTRR